MVHCGGVKYPSVYVVDSHATRPPLPPRPARQQRAGPAQILLFLLVSVALCGMAIEACFIYHLYQTQVEKAATSSKSIGDKGTREGVTTPTKWPRFVDPPSKPAAHLTDGQDVVHGDEIMAWSTIADPLLYKLVYKDRSLIIQTEGYYYVYSKVSFLEKRNFHHSVHVKTKLYIGKSISLLESRTYSGKLSIQSNSYLGGVFHFYKDDAVFVQVSNTSQVVRHKASENVFGAIMI